jgi:hypothetical protein
MKVASKGRPILNGVIKENISIFFHSRYNVKLTTPSNEGLISILIFSIWRRH